MVFPSGVVGAIVRAPHLDGQPGFALDPILMARISERYAVVNETQRPHFGVL